MGSDLYLNPPQKVWEKVAHGTSEAGAIEYVVGAMTHDWEIRLQPDAQGWTVLVFKGQWS